MQSRRDAEQEGCRAGGMQSRWDAGKVEHGFLMWYEAHSLPAVTCGLWDMGHHISYSAAYLNEPGGLVRKHASAAGAARQISDAP